MTARCTASSSRVTESARMSAFTKTLALASLLTTACATASNHPDDSINDCDPDGYSARSGTPDKCQVYSAMRPIAPAVANCSKTRGWAAVALTFAPDGRVIDAKTVPGKAPNGTTFSDPSVLDCVVAEALRARVPPF